MRKTIFQVTALVAALVGCLGVQAEVKIPAFGRKADFLPGLSQPRDFGATIFADYNKDGKQDAFVYGYGCAKLFNGVDDTTYTDASLAGLPDMLWCGSAVWVDYNNDTYPDLVMVGNGKLPGAENSTDLALAFKNTAGVLAVDATISLQAMQSGNEGAPSCIAVGDYDGDGYPDLLLSGKSGDSKYFYLYKNNGTAGGFTRQTTAFKDGATTGEFPVAESGSVTFVDMTGDDKLDILFNGHADDGAPGKVNDARAGIYKNNGDGTFEALVYFDHAAYGGGAAAIDYDGDNDQDVVITGTYWQSDWQWWNTYLYKNNGNGTFTQVTDHNLPPTTNSGIAVGDINKDGLMDLVITGQLQNVEGQAVSAFYNKGGDSAKFERKGFLIGKIEKGAPTLVDIDADNDLDLVVTGDGSNPIMLINKFPEVEGEVVLPDFPTPAEVSNKATFDTVPTTAFPTISAGGGAVWGDYDNDGKLDVFVWGMGVDDAAATSKLFKNNGDGTFSDVSSTILGPSFPKLFNATAVWLDYNNDDCLDLLVSGAQSKSSDGKLHDVVTRLYTNGGALDSWQLKAPYIDFRGTLKDTEKGGYVVEKDGGASRNIAVADYDNDGYPDLLFNMRLINETCNDAAGDGCEKRSFEIYKNNKGAGFVRKEASETGIYYSMNGGGLAVGDVDKDGDVDFAYTAYGDEVEDSYTSGVYINNGNGTFTDNKLYWNGADYGHAAEGMKVFGGEQAEVLLMDYNADGHLDVVVGGPGTRYYPFSSETRTYGNFTTGWDWWKTYVFLYDPATKTYGNCQAPDMITRVTGNTQGSLAACDFNGDGRPDLVSTGQNAGLSIDYISSNDVASSNRYWNGNLQQGMVNVVDFNNDGKMDIFANGQEGTMLLRNTSSTALSAPAAPSGLTATPGSEDGSITITWNADAVATTRYNVVLTKPNEADGTTFVICQAPVNIETGALKVGLDRAPLLTATSYSLKGIPGGDYTVKVQAIGASCKASEFATTTATVKGGASTGVKKQALGNLTAYKSGSAIVVKTDIAGEAEMTVYSVSGAKVWSKTGVFAGTTEINGLTQGALYFVVVRKGQGQEVCKVLL